ncbi:hypothetical protein Gohar_002811 [Gossypium harknessii]|uniref:Uncharacterized protein n=1 Tax=Gossypium harknessii TaxID=34285 RepID=A0A7J9HPP3_9ROSI|nr:hypothetical protein [Gossypium harknessii]
MRSFVKVKWVNVLKYQEEILRFLTEGKEMWTY